MDATHSAAARGRSVSHSLLHMWRVVIAIAHADGHLHPDERAYFERIIINLRQREGLSAQQEDILRNDLDVEQNIGDLMRQINDPAMRANVFYFGRILANIDGDMHPDEEAVLKRLHLEHMESIDMTAVRSEVATIIKSEMTAHNENIESLRYTKGFMGALDRLLLWLGIDVLG